MVFDLTSEQEKRLPPDQQSIKKILRWGIDHPGIISENPKISLNAYKLAVDGEVENPITFGWQDFLALPQTVSVSDFHCVEGWSVLDCRWEGVHIKEIEHIVKPRAVARAVTFTCADGYTTSLFREELAPSDVLLVHKLNGEVLEEGYGFPVRLIVPSKYAYKSALWVERLTFMRGKDLGFWERRGYSDSADVWKNDRYRR
jgi:DMSO/TMAO reductase YedYZ molybdopterin-dependent catalytic subunit